MVSQQPTFTLGRLLMTLVALSTSISPYLADYNPTHVFNPNWPPHARFHNGQTMSLGCCLGLLTLYFTWRPVLSSIHFTDTAVKDSIWCAALTGSMYYVTGLSAGLYPGAKFLDPEFVGTKYDVSVGGLPVQVTVFAVHGGLAWIAYALERRRLNALVR